MQRWNTTAVEVVPQTWRQKKELLVWEIFFRVSHAENGGLLGRADPLKFSLPTKTQVITAIHQCLEI